MENKRKIKKKDDNSRSVSSVLTELFMCTKCTKTYHLKHSLIRHLKFECGITPKYACKHCSRLFKHKYDLNVHEKSVHVAHIV